MKRIAVLSGMFMASAWLIVGCGTGNSVVPQAPVGGVAGGVAGCAYGMTYYPGNNYGGGYGYGGYGGCVAGYTFNGSTCVCATNYYNNGYGNPYGGGNGYPYACPPPTVYVQGYGCR